MSRFKRVDPEAPAAAVAPDNGEGWRVVEGFGIPPRQRQSGQSKYPVARLKPGDAIVSDNQADIRNAKVAASVYGKRVAADNNGVGPKFVTRKKDILDAEGKVTKSEYALIRES